MVLWSSGPTQTGLRTFFSVFTGDVWGFKLSFQVYNLDVSVFSLLGGSRLKQPILSEYTQDILKSLKKVFKKV